SRSFVGAVLATMVPVSAARADEQTPPAPPAAPAPTTATTAAPTAPAIATPSPTSTTSLTPTATAAPTDTEHKPAIPSIAQAGPPPAGGTVEAATPVDTVEEKATPEVELNGSFDAYSGVNFTNPDSGLNKLRAFDTEDRGFSLNYAELVLARNKG